MFWARDFIVVFLLTKNSYFYDNFQFIWSQTRTYMEKSFISNLSSFIQMAISLFYISCCYFMGFYLQIFPILSFTFYLMRNLDISSSKFRYFFIILTRRVFTQLALSCVSIGMSVMYQNSCNLLYSYLEALLTRKSWILIYPVLAGKPFYKQSEVPLINLFYFKDNYPFFISRPDFVPLLTII